MKLFFHICFVMAITVKLFAQVPQYYNTKKMAQVTSLPGGDLSNIWGYTAPDGKEYAIVGSKTATNIYDVSDCGNPILKASIIDSLNTRWREYKVYKNFLYSVSELDGGSGSHGGLKMFDLTNINNITYSNATQVDSFFTNGHTLSIDTATSRLYVSGAGAGHLFIYQLSPNNIRPKLIKKIVSLSTSTKDGYIHDLYAHKDTIYASHPYTSGWFSVYRLRMSPDTALIRLGFNDQVNGLNHSSWPHPLHPQYFYCATENQGVPMTIYEVQNDNNIAVNVLKKHQFKDPLGAPTFNNNIYHNPHAKGNELFISAYNDGVVIYDISEPLQPVKVAHYDSYPAAPTATSGYTGFQGAWGIYPFFTSGCHLVSDMFTGFHTFKTDFRKATFTGTLHLTSPDAGIVLMDSLNQLTKLKVGNNGALIRQSISISSFSPGDMRIDSADVEILNNNNLILTSQNGSKYAVFVNSSGQISSQLASLISTTNTTSHQGNIWINQSDKGLIMKSIDNQRWKMIAKPSNIVTARKSAF
jgi:hypothetical protein